MESFKMPLIKNDCLKDKAISSGVSREIKKKHPDSKITVLCSLINKELIEKNKNKKMTKIVLISLYDTASIGPRILHKVLDEKGYEVHSIFFKSGNLTNVTKKEVKLLLDKINEIKPQLIGISLRSRCFKIATRLTKDIRKEIDTKIIWGGVHPTIKPMDCLKFADMICIGEGEEALVNLADLIDKKKSIENVKNIWIKFGKKIIKNDLAHLEEDLDKIPFPDFSDSNKYYVEDNKCSCENIFPDHQIVYTIMTTRGCPFSCSFCNGGSLREIYHGKGRYLRRRSVENVIEELVLAKKSWPSIKKVYFIDDVFSYDLEWIKKFNPLYKRHIGLPFYCYVHPVYVKDETIKVLKDMALYEVNIGIQSGSEKLRKEIYHRPESNEQIVNSIKILNKYKIRAVCDLILGNPYETESDKKENLNLLVKLPKPIILLTYNLLFFPNKLTEMALEDGLISEKDLEENKERVYHRWDDKFLQNFSNTDLLWNGLYYLASKGYPDWLIKWCYKSMKKNPAILVSLVKGIERKNLLISSVPKIMGYVKRKQFKLLFAKLKRNLRLTSLR